MSLRRLPDWRDSQPPKIRLPLKVDGPEIRQTEHRPVEPGELPPAAAIRSELERRRSTAPTRILPTSRPEGE